MSDNGLGSVKSYGIVDWKYWYKLYELEYKLFTLMRKPELTDQQYLYYSRIYSELVQVVDRLLNIYYDAFENYIGEHIDYDGFGSIGPQDIDYVLGHEFAEVFEEIQQAYQSEDLKAKIKALTQAKDFEHSYAQHVVTLKGESNREDVPVNFARYCYNNDCLVWDDNSVEDFYSALTKGKFIPEWDVELKKSAGAFNWYRFACGDNVF